MKVRYVSDMRYPWPPGQDFIDEDVDFEDLPPLAQRTIERDGLGSVLTEIYHWEYLGADVWWWVRPCAS